jgi:spermidine/putrescine transport system substrate-binding protein
MLIPAGAPDPLDAITYMNYVYDPQVAALMANYIWYVTPVPSAKPIVATLPAGRAVADSPLVFPDQAMYAQTHQYYVFTGTADLDRWNSTFDPIING